MELPHDEVIRWNLRTFCQANPNALNMELGQLLAGLEKAIGIPSGTLEQKQEFIVECLQTDAKIIEILTGGGGGDSGKDAASSGGGVVGAKRTDQQASAGPNKRTKVNGGGGDDSSSNSFVSKIPLSSAYKTPPATGSSTGAGAAAAVSSSPYSAPAPTTSAAAVPSSSFTGNLPTASRNDDNDMYWDLGEDLSRVTVRQYRGKTLVDLRKYYRHSDGTLKPGKKGISLNVEQWRALINHMSSIDASLKHKK